MRVLIVDDERPARENLRSLVERRDDATVVGEAADGEAAVRAIRDLRPDLVFLDVQMPGSGGFDVLYELAAEEIPLVVFVTGYEEHAVRAFEENALDYLLKPFSDERFDLALDRARRALEREEGSRMIQRLVGLVESRRAGRPPRRLEVRTSRGAEYVPVEEIDWIGAEDVYVRIHAGERSYLIRERIADLARTLEGEGFVRIHRSTIVNVDRVRRLERDAAGGENAILEDGTSHRVARSRRTRLLDALGSS